MPARPCGVNMTESYLPEAIRTSSISCISGLDMICERLDGDNGCTLMFVRHCT